MLELGRVRRRPVLAAEHQGVDRVPGDDPVPHVPTHPGAREREEAGRGRRPPARAPQDRDQRERQEQQGVVLRARCGAEGEASPRCVRREPRARECDDVPCAERDKAADDDVDEAAGRNPEE